MSDMASAVARELSGSFRGDLLSPESSGYDEARAIWNGMYDRHPALIARCTGTSDVIRAVKFAREHNLTVSVKGGGHNAAGNAVVDDAFVIDLSLMGRVEVDTKRKTCRVDGGALLGDVDKKTQLHGLAVPAGIISHTGVGGLALGGGFGWISRKHGHTVDNLISAEIVTADGELLTASADENPDLYWGIRGGGGNFGIVTSFTFRCAEIGIDIPSGIIAKKFENAREYIQFHRDYVRTLPDEMTVWMVIRHAPPLPFLPEDTHGKLMVLIPYVWLGEEAEGEKLLQPIRDKTESHGEFIGTHPWAGWQSGFDGLVEHGARNYWKSHQMNVLSDEAIDAVLEFAEKMPTGECEVFIPHMEGVAGRVPADETAFSFRESPFVLNIHTRWRDQSDDDRCMAWARDFHSATQPFASGVYVNFISEEGKDRVKDAYTKPTWDRLVKIKRKYDPDNFFRMNQNINPTNGTY